MNIVTTKYCSADLRRSIHYLHDDVVGSDLLCNHKMRHWWHLFLILHHPLTSECHQIYHSSHSVLHWGRLSSFSSHKSASHQISFVPSRCWLLMPFISSQIFRKNTRRESRGSQLMRSYQSKVSAFPPITAGCHFHQCFLFWKPGLKHSGFTMFGSRASSLPECTSLGPPDMRFLCGRKPS